MVAKARQELLKHSSTNDQLGEARATLSAAAASYDQIGSRMRASRLLDRLHELPVDR